MSYININNLYKDQTILMFKEVYSLEKIYGCSTHIKWKHETQTIHFFSSNADYQEFVGLFDFNFLKQKFIELFPDKDVTIYGEAYGGKMQGMSKTYGNQLKFIAFDVKVGVYWLNVPSGENVCNKFGIEYVYYKKISTEMDEIEKEFFTDSVQAIRNGMGTGHKHEGIVLRPLIELRKNNGDRVIAKHKRDEFIETKTRREISSEQLQVLEDAHAIAEEWVVNERLNHVLQRFPEDIGIESIGSIIKAMIDDVFREGQGEIVESKEARRAIGVMTIKLFRIKKNIEK